MSGLTLQEGRMLCEFVGEKKAIYPLFMTFPVDCDSIRDSNAHNIPVGQNILE